MSIGQIEPAIEARSAATVSISTRNRTCVWRGPDCLVIRPNWKGRLSGFIPLIFGWSGPFMVYAFLAWEWPMGLGMRVLGGLVILVWGLLSLFFLWVGFSSLFDLRRYRFDRLAGEFRHGPLGLRRRPLHEIHAIQLLHATSFHELNVVFRDGKRVNISSHGDEEWTRDTAKQLTSLLSVPLIEQTEEQPKSDVESVSEKQAEELPLDCSVTVNGQRMEIESLPLRSTTYDFQTMRLAEPDPNMLELRYTWGGRTAIIVVTLFALSLLGVFVTDLILELRKGLGWMAAIQAMSVFELLLLGSACLGLLGMALGLFSRRPYRFDKARGEFTYGKLWSRQSLALDRIAAVQLIPGGTHVKTITFGQSKPGCYRAFQLNLVLRGDNGLDRLNVLSQADREGTRALGTNLAGFLGVPLVDQLR